MLKWYPNRYIAKIAICLFYENMGNFVPKGYIKFLPKQMGGMSFPNLNMSNEEVMEKIYLTEPSFYYLLSGIISKPNVTDYNWVWSLLSSMSAGNYSRGSVIDPMSKMIVDQYAASAYNRYREESKTFNQLLEEYKNFYEGLKQKMEEEKRFLSPFKGDPESVKRYANSLDLMSPFKIAKTIDRISNLKIAFAVADGTLGIDELLSVNKRIDSPEETYNKFLKSIWVQDPGFDKIIDEGKSESSLKRFREWISTFKFVCSPMNSLWVPRRAIVDSLNGLSIDLPYKSLGDIPGTISDPNIQVTEGWKSMVISLKRTSTYYHNF
jgi:hypothetical protein